MIAGANEKLLQALTTNAEGKGLAFQIIDEILDLTGMTIDDPISLETKINSIPGVVDNGIFGLRKADQIFIG